MRRGYVGLQYLDYELNRIEILLKNRPCLKEKVLWPLSLKCKATVEDIYRMAEKLKQEYKAFQPYDLF